MSCAPWGGLAREVRCHLFACLGCDVVAIVEETLEALRSAISEASPVNRLNRVPRFDLVAAVEELVLWVGDEHQSTNAFSANWVSLIDDTVHSMGECGPGLSAALHAGDATAIDELQACRRILKNRRAAPDPALARRLAHVANHLSANLKLGSTLRAAFDDLAGAESPSEIENRAALLISLIQSAGHDPHWFPRRIGAILADDAASIAAARGDESGPDDPMARAGCDPETRFELARDVLGESPETGTVVVWLRFAHAFLGWPPLIELGPDVTVFDDQWLHSSLKPGPSQELTRLAPETSRQEGWDVKRFVGDIEPDRKESKVFLRVSVDAATTFEAHNIARRTGDTIAGLASLYGTPSILWELEASYVMYTQHGAGGSMSSESTTTLTIRDQHSVQTDHTANTLADLADRLGPHLPVRDPDIAHAATLLSWLRRARSTQAAPRVLLCDRVVEQVSGWAGFADPRAFASEVLRLAWSISRIRNAIGNAAFASSMELRRLGEMTLADEFSNPSGSGPVDLRDFLKAFPSISAAFGAKGAQVADRRGVESVLRLAPHLESPAASRIWLEAYLKDFTRQEARRRRTRNLLVHGGPLSERTIEATVGFSEALAVLALGDCIRGRLEDQDLIDHFLGTRNNLSRVYTRLKKEDPLADVLFWD